MEKLDYRKDYKDLYLPGIKPVFIEVPEMKYIMIDGEGDPNTSESYQNAVEILYGLSYGIKMSKKTQNIPHGYFDYAVFPLEGLWDAKAGALEGDRLTDKGKFRWTAMIRQPEFVTDELFTWAKEKLAQKKPELDLNTANYLKFREGMCCQIMHRGSYDNEPETIQRLTDYILESGYVVALSETRRHHEIYLGDPRKTKPENLKTAIRYPVRKKA